MEAHVCVSLKLTAYLRSLPVAYLETSQTSLMESFANIVHGFLPLQEEKRIRSSKLAANV